MKIKQILCVVLLATLLGGCTLKVVGNSQGEDPGQLKADAKAAEKVLTDLELYQEALTYLSNSEKEPNYMEARVRLDSLVLRYPQSRWAASAQALILTLEKISTLQAKIRQEKQKAQTDHGKLTKEIDGLKDNCKNIEERYVSDMARLQLENEQLRNDIQQLKRLEVQLERREKMLR